MSPPLAGGLWISAGRSYFVGMSLETLAPAARSRTRPPLSDHLKRLESESIEIIREVAAAFDNPVMLYSIGKDSGVMLHLAAKAFYPGAPPFPLLHVDTTWKFRDMIRHRDTVAERYGVKLLVYTNDAVSYTHLTLPTIYSV